MGGRLIIIYVLRFFAAGFAKGVFFLVSFWVYKDNPSGAEIVTAASCRLPFRKSELCHFSC